MIYADSCDQQPRQLIIELRITPTENREGVVRDPIAAMKYLSEHLEEALPQRFKGKRFRIVTSVTDGTYLSDEERGDLAALSEMAYRAGGGVLPQPRILVE